MTRRSDSSSRLHRHARPVSAAPRSEAELLGRSEALVGLSLRCLAQRQRIEIPRERRRAKGWAGTLIETALGASAGSRPEPDFELIGIELKTLPVYPTGRPKESTYVCAVPLSGAPGLTWMDSCVYRKTRCVLWVPLVAAAAAEPCQQHIGQPFLWRPTRTEDLALSADWEELMETVCLGQLDTLTAHRGHCLQIRPKAANAQARRWGIDATGRPAPTLPRGFYLRSEFTEALVRRHLVVP